MSSQTSDNNPSPVLTISILCIVGASSLFLLAYYVFFHKCSSSFLRFFSLTTDPVAADEDSFIALSPITNWTRTIGLDDLAIRDLPTRHYYHHHHHTTATTETTTTVDYFKCVVCLNDFHEHDVLRVLPNCAHSFHLDCIDVWLHSNSNCPICRTGINSSSSSTFGFVAPMSSPQREAESVIGSDEDFVVIELGGGGGDCNGIARSDSMRRKQSPPLQQSTPGKQGKRRNASIMGDEGIDMRGGGDRFMVEYPMRRSFSWGSAADRQLLSSVRAVVRQNSQSRCCDEAESGSSSSRAFVLRTQLSSLAKRTRYSTHYYSLPATLCSPVPLMLDTSAIFQSLSIHFYFLQRGFISKQQLGDGFSINSPNGCSWLSWLLVFP